jgi:hypothetical protein
VLVSSWSEVAVGEAEEEGTRHSWVSSIGIINDGKVRKQPVGSAMKAQP